MEKLIIGLMLLFSISAGGCVSSTVTGSTERNAARMDNFVKKMDEGKTTRKQEQSMLRANRIMWHALNYYLNDVLLPPDIPKLEEN